MQQVALLWVLPWPFKIFADGSGSWMVDLEKVLQALCAPKGAYRASNIFSGKSLVHYYSVINNW